MSPTRRPPGEPSLRLSALGSGSGASPEPRWPASDWPWVVAAAAGRASAEERARFLAAIRDGGLERGRVVIATCHRVELHGIGERPEADAAAAFPWRSLRVLVGPDAARHVLRLAAGLESAVLGEEQILGQVRDAHRLARQLGPLDPRLDRLFQIALRVGRAARAAGRPNTDGLARRAVLALAERLAVGNGSLEGRTVLVVGAGTIGRLLALAAARAGATLLLASRDPVRASALLRTLDEPGEALDLSAAAGHWKRGTVDGVVVALGGPWSELDGLAGSEDERPGAPADVFDPPPIVDLSAPSAVPESIRRRLGVRFVGIDDLAERSRGWPAGASAGPTGDELAYRDRAEALVSEGLGEYRSWLVARLAGAAIRSLEAEAEAIRAAEVEALFRRLPDLGPRERDLVSLHARRIVARLLHPTIRRLRTGGRLDGAGSLLEP